MLGKISCFCCSLLTSFKTFFQKILSGSQTVLIQDLGPNCLQKLTASKERVKVSLYSLVNIISKYMQQTTFSESNYLDTYLSVISDIVSQADKAGLEFLRLQSASSVLVKVIERQTELIHLIFTNAL